MAVTVAAGGDPMVHFRTLWLRLPLQSWSKFRGWFGTFRWRVYCPGCLETWLLRVTWSQCVPFSSIQLLRWSLNVWKSQRFRSLYCWSSSLGVMSTHVLLFFGNFCSYWLSTFFRFLHFLPKLFLKLRWLELYLSRGKY